MPDTAEHSVTFVKEDIFFATSLQATGRTDIQNRRRTELSVFVVNVDEVSLLKQADRQQRPGQTGIIWKKLTRHAYEKG